MNYLKTRSQKNQAETFRKMIKAGAPCLILTRNFNPTDAMLRVAQELDFPLIRTTMITSKRIRVTGNVATTIISITSSSA